MQQQTTILGQDGLWQKRLQNLMDQGNKIICLTPIQTITLTLSRGDILTEVNAVHVVYESIKAP